MYIVSTESGSSIADYSLPGARLLLRKTDDDLTAILWSTDRPEFTAAVRLNSNKVSTNLQRLKADCGAHWPVYPGSKNVKSRWDEVRVPPYCRRTGYGNRYLRKRLCDVQCFNIILFSRSEHGKKWRYFLLLHFRHTRCIIIIHNNGYVTLYSSVMPHKKRPNVK